MADTGKHPGRLIAVDGSRGKDTHAAADAIVEALKRAGVECAISRWDASGLFTDLAAPGRVDRRLSARTLSLVYAADLAFRLRWEIRPVLESGGVIYGSYCALLRLLTSMAGRASARSIGPGSHESIVAIRNTARSC
jgi:hypothetical protein